MSTDPFGIEKALRFPNKADNLRTAGRGGKHKVSNAVRNKTSKPAVRDGTDTKFGSVPKMTEMQRSNALTGALYGAAGGSVAGTVANPRYGEYSRNTKATKENRKQILANGTETRKLKRQQKVSKARAHLLTDVGTKANRQYPHARKMTAAVAAGTAGGAGLGWASTNMGADEAQKRVKRQKATLKRQEKTLATLRKSAVEKASTKEKAQFAANATVGGAAGGVAGAALANRSVNRINAARHKRAAKDGFSLSPSPKAHGGYLRGAKGGALIGGAGALGAMSLSSHLKNKEKVGKSMSTSAFGVDHG